MGKPAKSAYFYKAVQKLFSVSAFSMAEIMITLTIMAVLFGVAVVSGDRWIQAARQDSLDDMAETLYQAANSNLSNAFSIRKGALDSLNLQFEKEGDLCLSSGALSGSRNDTFADTMRSILVPDGSVNDEILGGKWYISYIIGSNGAYYGAVTDVFFTTDTEEHETYFNTNIPSRIGALKNKTTRRSEGSKVGYYGPSSTSGGGGEGGESGDGGGVGGGGGDSGSVSGLPVGLVAASRPEPRQEIDTFYYWMEEPNADDEELSVTVHAHIPEVFIKSGTPPEVKFTLTLSDGTNSAVRVFSCGRFMAEKVDELKNKIYYNDSTNPNEKHYQYYVSSSGEVWPETVTESDAGIGKSIKKCWDSENNIYTMRVVLDSLDSGKERTQFKNLFNTGTYQTFDGGYFEGTALTPGANLTVSVYAQCKGVKTDDSAIKYSERPTSYPVNSLFSFRTDETTEEEKTTFYVAVKNRRHLQNLDSTISGFAAVGTADNGKRIRVLQTENINLEGGNFTPITNTSIYSFNGNDGKQRKISNLTVSQTTGNAGLFSVFKGAELYNITLESPDVSTENGYAGAVAGQIEPTSGDTFTVSGVTIQSPRVIAVNTKTNNEAGCGGGGIAGRIANDNATIRISGVTVSNAVMRSESIEKYALSGAVAGVIRANIINITGCRISSPLMEARGFSDTGIGGAAGIAGQMYVKTSCTIGDTAVQNPIITADGLHAAAGGLLGAVEGLQDGNTAATLTINSCGVYWISHDSTWNNTAPSLSDAIGGSVYAQEASSGGLIGYVGDPSNTRTPPSVEIDKSYAAAVIKMEVDHDTKAGGLVGEAAEVTVTNSYADCYMQAKRIGGLAGLCADWNTETNKGSSFTGSYSAGFVLCGDYGEQVTAAGITLNNAKVENCYSLFNFDDITTGVADMSVSGSNVTYKPNSYLHNRAGKRYAFTEKETYAKDTGGNYYTYKDVSDEDKITLQSKGGVVAYLGSISFASNANTSYNLHTSLSGVASIMANVPQISGISNYYGDWLPCNKEARITATYNPYSNTFTFEYDDVAKSATSSAPVTADNLRTLFKGNTNLVSVNFTGLDTSSVTDVSGMFQNCINLTSAESVTGWLGLIFNSSTKEISLPTPAATPTPTPTPTATPTPSPTPTPAEFYSVFNGTDTLTFYYDEKKFSRGTTYEVETDIGSYRGAVMDMETYRTIYDVPGWYAKKDQITTVVFDSSCANNTDIPSMAYWFYGLSNLATFTNPQYLNTSKTEDMSYLFANCTALSTLDVSGLDTSSVTKMTGMFAMSPAGGPATITLVNGGTTAFDTSNVTDMASMFYGCNNLTSLDVSKFDTFNVTNMSGMFGSCSKLGILNLSGFDTSSVTDMSGMFGGCSGLTSLTLGGKFNTARVTNMNGMFGNCAELTTLNVSGFNTSNVLDMGGMFGNCAKLTTLDLTSFNTSKVTNMSYMFRGSTALTSLDLSSFDTRNVSKMHYMFNGCSALAKIQASDGFVTSGIKLAAYGTAMFTGCSSLQGGSGTQFADAKVATYTYARIDASGTPGYFTSKDAPTPSPTPSPVPTGSAIYYKLENTTLILCVASYKKDDYAQLQTKYNSSNELPWYSNRANISLVEMRGNLASSEIHTDYWFAGFTSLTTIYASNNMNGSTVTSSVDMFKNCKQLEGDEGTKFVDKKASDPTNAATATYARIDGGNSNPGYFTSPVYARIYENTPTTDPKKYTLLLEYGAPADSSFKWEKAMKRDGLDLNVLTTDAGFATYKSSVTTFTLADNVKSGSPTSITPLNLNRWFSTGTEAVFSSLATLNLSGLDTSGVTDMSYMFAGCNQLTMLDVNSLNVNNVTNMHGTFAGCTALELLDLTDWNTGNVTDMRGMFSGCSKLKTIYAGDNFNTNSVTQSSGNSSDGMFYNCTSLVGGLGTTLASTGNIVDKTYAKIDASGDPASNGYFTRRDIVYARVYNYGTTESPAYQLVFECGKKVGTYGIATQAKVYRDAETLGLSSLSNSTSITSIVFDDTVNTEGNKIAPKSGSDFKSWFTGRTALQSIEHLNYVDTRYITDMSGLFSGCTGLTTLDLSGFNTGGVEDDNAYNGVTDMSNMFNGCSALTTIYASDSFVVEQVTESTNMFANCSESLKGGNNTTWDSSHIDKEYARIDTSETPGYFTQKPVPAEP